MVNKTFILAGKAIFTINNNKGEHLTFRIDGKPDRNNPNAKVYFAKVLTGPDNLSNYTYMGLLRQKDLRLILTKNSRFTKECRSIRVFCWAMQIINGTTKLPEGYAIKHAGRCCRCAKLLTDPESIEVGIGPECRKRMGL